MNITAIKSYPINVGTGTQLVVKIEADNGLHGWGASGLSSRELAVVGMIQHFSSFLIGRNAMQIEALWQEMYRGQYFEGGRVITAAISAIDIALYDLKGKMLNVPVYELLGGKQRDYVECFASLRFRTYEELLQKAKKLVDAGWKVIRLAPAEYENSPGEKRFNPRQSIALIAKWLSALRQELGTEIMLGIDYHTRLSVPETVSFLQRLAPGTIDFIEEPIRDQSPAAYQALRQMVDVPFAIGEEFASKWQFQPFLERQLTQFARVDVCNVGGLTEAKKVAAIAEVQYIDLMPHNPLGPICTAASIHLAAACTNFAFLEEINTQIEQTGTNDPLFYPIQPELINTKYQVPDGPGLGVDFNEALAMQQQFQPIEVPRLKKDDASFTNW